MELITRLILAVVMAWFLNQFINDLSKGVEQVINKPAIGVEHE